MTGRTINHPIVLWLSTPLAILVIIASCAGLFSRDLYAAETPNWKAQAVGQDLVDLLLIVPCLITTSFIAFYRKTAFLLWGGVVMYLAYTFAIYCFDTHFNQMFVVYCMIMGLSFYAALYYLFTVAGEKINEFSKRKPIVKITGIYFLVIAAAFCLLWLSDVVPAVINNVVPEDVRESGLFTNPVHVIDLSVFLPGIFITGILTLKKRNKGLLIAPALLMFFVLMDITIGALTIIMKARGIDANLSLTFIMGLLALVSAVILIRFIKTVKPATLTRE